MNDQPRRPAALVTGGAIRVGRALALALAEDGYDVAILFNRSKGPAAETAEDIERLGAKCHLVQYDLHDAEGMDAMLGSVLEALPNLRVLVNSASGYTPGPLRETDVATFDDQMQLNLRAPFFMTKAFANQVAEGHVINIIDNKIGYNQYAYAAYLLSKKALAELTRMAALELAPKIQVNGIAPGVILPAVSRSAEYIEWRRQAIPLHRTGAVEDLAGALRYLLNSRFVTGSIMVVDGGENIAFEGRNAPAYGPDGT